MRLGGGLSSRPARAILALSLSVAAAAAVWMTRCARAGAGGEAQAAAACPVDVKRFEVRGTSMEGLFSPGASVEAEMGRYTCQPPERGDVAVVALPWRGDPIIKRVLALPGDHVSLAASPEGARLVVNGVALSTPAGVLYRFSGKRERMLRLYVDQLHGVLPADQYLVLGTEPGGSLDSSQIGPVQRAALAGRVRVAGR